MDDPLSMTHRFIRSFFAFSFIDSPINFLVPLFVHSVGLFVIFFSSAWEQKPRTYAEAGRFRYDVIESAATYRTLPEEQAAFTSPSIEDATERQLTLHIFQLLFLFIETSVELRGNRRWRIAMARRGMYLLRCFDR